MLLPRIVVPILTMALVLTACSHGPDSLAPEQRYVTSELPASARVGFRHLPLHGAPNFRDLGGYTTSDGQAVKWGMLYRSDTLSDLSADDQRYLERLNIQRIIDFRFPAEIADAPDKLSPQLQQRYVSMPIGFNSGDYNRLVKKILSGDTKDLNLEHTLEEANVRFVRESTPVLRTWLHGLVETDSGAQVFHCTAGKDRTGLAAAVFLLSLGVPKDQVMQDYLASNAYLQQKTIKAVWKMRIFSLGRADVDGVMPVLEVRQRYLQAAFDTMQNDYGSIDNYLRDGLGVDEAFRAQLRARYLEPLKI